LSSGSGGARTVDAAPGRFMMEMLRFPKVLVAAVKGTSSGGHLRARRAGPTLCFSVRAWGREGAGPEYSSLRGQTPSRCLHGAIIGHNRNIALHERVAHVACWLGREQSVWGPYGRGNFENVALIVRQFAFLSGMVFGACCHLLSSITFTI